MSDFIEIYKDLKEKEENTRFLKLKYLMNLYYFKAKNYKYFKLFTTFLAPLIIVVFNYILKNKEMNTAIQFFSSSILFIVYIYSDYELMKYKLKASYVHEELDSIIFDFTVKKYNKYEDLIEDEIKRLDAKDMYLKDLNHYDDLDKGIPLIYKDNDKIDKNNDQIYKNKIIRNIQKSNLLASIKTRNIYIKFNILILMFIYLIILSNIYLFEYTKIPKIVYNSVDSIILLIPIAIVIINESMNLLREKEKINNILKENEEINEKTNKTLQEFIYELRSEYTEIPTFIYEYAYNEKNINAVSEVILNMFKFIYICIRGIVLNIWEIISTVVIIPIFKVLKKIIENTLIVVLKIGKNRRLNHMYIMYLYICKFRLYKKISWEQKYYNIWSREVLKYINWKTLYAKLIKNFGCKANIVGSVYNNTVLDLDLDIHIKVLNKNIINSVFYEIKNSFQQKGEFEKEVVNNDKNCIDVVFNSNRKWKVDIRITSDDTYIGKSDIDNINHKKYARKIIFIKNLIKDGIIPKVPSAYIYYIVISKNKSVFKSIEILFKYWEIYKESSSFNDINTFIKFCDRE